MVSFKNEREPIKVPDDFIYSPIESISVREWHPPTPDGGPATEIHLMIFLKSEPENPLLMRFSGPGTLDSLVSALVVHRQNVFGRYG